VCHAVLAPGSNETLNAWTLAGSSVSIMGSCHTLPVKYLDDAFLVGREPDLIICIALTSFPNNCLHMNIKYKFEIFDILYLEMIGV
jgi:hypothetical protein